MHVGRVNIGYPALSLVDGAFLCKDMAQEISENVGNFDEKIKICSLFMKLIP